MYKEGTHPESNINTLTAEKVTEREEETEGEAEGQTEKEETEKRKATSLPGCELTSFTSYYL